MSANDFNAAFQARVLQAAPAQLSSVHEIALEAVHREQRRVRILAAISVLFWLLGIAGMVPMVIGLNELMMSVRLNGVENNTAQNKTEQNSAEQNDAEKSGLVDLNRKVIEQARSTQLLHETFPFILASLASLFLAALFTVLLVFSSRRATLNRINISLAQICEQLQQMRQPPPGSSQTAAAN